jgi:hypothetical protein
VKYLTLWLAGVVVGLVGCSTDTTIGTGAGGGAGGNGGGTSGLGSLDLACALEPLSPDVSRIAGCPNADTAHEFSAVQDFETSSIGTNGLWWAWGEPGTTSSAHVEALDNDACGQQRALVISSSEQVLYGSGWGPGTPVDAQGWDGLALRARAGTALTIGVQLSVLDPDSGGRTIDSTTGERTCYTQGDDWDLDGQPNTAPPPTNLACSNWWVSLAFDTDFSVVLIPWAAFEQPNAALRAGGLDVSRLVGQFLRAGPCSGFELWIDEMDLYRAKP